MKEKKRCAFAKLIVNLCFSKHFNKVINITFLITCLPFDFNMFDSLSANFHGEKCNRALLH